MKVRIGHLDYTVRRPNGEETHLESDTLGMCYPSLGVIWLRDEGPPSQQAATLMHEVLHSIYWAFRVPKKASEEDTVRALEGPMVAFLSDNPQAVAAIIAARGGVPLPIPN